MSLVKNLEEALKLFQSIKNEPPEAERSKIAELISKIPLFTQTYPKLEERLEFLKQNINLFKLEHIAKSKALFHLGDFGTRFYIIIKGKVAVYIPRKKAALLKAQAKLFEEIEKDEKPENGSAFELSKEEEILFQNKDRPGMYFQGKLCLFEAVSRLEPGEYFGETCNLNNNIRNASIFAYEDDVYLLWMQGKDYLRFFNRSVEEALVKQKCVAEIYPDFTSATVKNVSFYFKPWEFPSGRMIYDEGDTCSFLAYLTDGGIELSKLIIQEDEEKKRSQPEDLTNMALKKIIKKRIIISTRGPKNLFGDEELLLGSKTRAFRVNSTSYCKGYILLAEDLDLLRKIMPNVVQSMLIVLQKRLAWQEERVRFLMEDAKKITAINAISGPNEAKIKRPASSSISTKPGQKDINEDPGHKMFSNEVEKELLTNKRVTRIHSAKTRPVSASKENVFQSDENSKFLKSNIIANISLDESGYILPRQNSGVIAKTEADEAPLKNFAQSSARLPPRPNMSNMLLQKQAKKQKTLMHISEEIKIDNDSSKLGDKKMIEFVDLVDRPKFPDNARKLSDFPLKNSFKASAPNLSPGRRTKTITRSNTLTGDDYHSISEISKEIVGSKEIVRHMLEMQEKDAKYEETILIDPEKVYFHMTVRGNHAQRKGLKNMLSRFYEKKKFSIEDKLGKNFMKDGAKHRNVQQFLKCNTPQGNTFISNNTMNSFSRTSSARDIDKKTLVQCEKVLRYTQAVRPSSAKKAMEKLQSERARQYDFVNLMSQFSPVAQDIMFNNMGGKQAVKTVITDVKTEKVIDLVLEENKAIQEKKAEIIKKMFKPPFFKRLDRPKE